jgi:hypothetical protein
MVNSLGTAPLGQAALRKSQRCQEGRGAELLAGLSVWTGAALGIDGRRDRRNNPAFWQGKGRAGWGQEILRPAREASWEETKTMEKPDYPCIHYSELKPVPPEMHLSTEFATYLREAPRLLAEGYEGKHVLIKGNQILGFFDTRGEGLAAGYRHSLDESFLVRHIQTYERLYWVRTHYICPI